MTVYDTMMTSIGELLLVAEDAGLTGLYFETYRHGRRPDPDWEHARERDGVASEVLADARAQLDAYFAGTSIDFTLPLATCGTPFQERVWSALREVPFGESITYSELARRIDAPSAVRAVGGANARNPISIIVPCHRVIGANGSLTGFGGGVERKQWLLQHEGARSVADTLQLSLRASS